MRLLELSLRNYRVFASVDLELPARVIGIFGENGSGKSSLMESIQWALYGTARTPKDQIRTHGVLTECQVRLVFEHGGRQYEARRVVKGKNHQVEAELLTRDLSLAVGVREVDEEVRKLLRMDQQVFRSSVFAEQKQLDAFSDLTKAKRKEMVLRLLGIKPVDAARTAARGEAKTVKTRASDLEEALPDAAELEARLESARAAEAEAARRHEAAREALTEIVARLADAEAAFEEIDAVRERAQRAETERRHLAEKVEGLEGRKAALDERARALREELAAVPALRQELAGLDGVRERLPLATELARVADELAHAEADVERLPEEDTGAAEAALAGAEDAVKAASAGATEARAHARRAKDDLSAAQGVLASAGDLDPSAPCPTCGQELGEGFGSYVDHCRGEAARLEALAKETAIAAKHAEKAERDAEQRLRDAKQHAEAVASRAQVRGQALAHADRLREKAGALRARFGDEQPDLAALTAAVERAGEIERVLARAEAEERQLAEADADLAKVATEREDARSALAALEKEVQGYGFDPDRHAAAREERDEARKLREEAAAAEREASDALKDAQKEAATIAADLERVRETGARVGELRDEARYAERVALLLDGFRDNLVSRIGPELSREAEALFRELTNHEYEDLKVDEEDLAIQIADAGRWWPIERFSGSEVDLANLALRVAISTHLSRMAGADLGMMVLDEVLASLDAERKDLLVQAMGRLSQRFHQLFVITHAEQVKDQFPATIEVRKVEPRRSEARLI